MRTKKERKPERLIELEKNYAIWRVPVELLREQDKNARVMDTEKFNRLTENIKNDGRLESMPLVQLKKNEAGNEEFFIISGHHRTRASRKAGVLNIPVLVIERKMTLDEIRSKQISHNSLDGYDDKQILKELYDEIKNINLKIASGLTDLEINTDLMSVSIDNIKVDLDYEVINILFLPKQVKHFEKVILGLRDEASVYIADKKEFEKFATLARKIADRDNIVNVAAIFARMLEIVDNELKDKEKPKKNLKAKK
ncbi:MAG: ParB N-terminal domain-containing protein [Candidatus Omnitrophica bacterium]|nr:ParB N-terminal domain-containing protein [Candidatus Omnitrophota bacterium]